MGKRVLYQLKSCGRDKLCILSFLLPVIAGLALNFLTDIDLTQLAEPEFAVLEGELGSGEEKNWLEQMGTVKEYASEEALKKAVLEPAGNVLGIREQGAAFRVICAGDEPEMIRKLADRLVRMYEERGRMDIAEITILPAEANAGIKPLFIAITMITAMFMGGTFSAMNILGEKEDGTALVNEILPQSRMAALLRKIMVGLLGGVLSALLTAAVCIHSLPLSRIPALFLLILLSGFLASLAGAFIGQAAGGLMSGIGLLKLVMLGFIAPPIVFYLLLPMGGSGNIPAYLVPSHGAFQGIMKLLGGIDGGLGEDIFALALHCMLWTAVYLAAEGGREGVA